MGQWLMALRGDGHVVEVVLRDCCGWRASHACGHRHELAEWLDGWEQYYGCDTERLFKGALVQASREVTATLHAFGLFGRGFRVLDPALTARIMELAKDPYRPKEILDLRERIEQETRAAEFRFANTGRIDEQQVQEIVGMKLTLDALYGSWAEGMLA